VKSYCWDSNPETSVFETDVSAYWTTAGQCGWRDLNPQRSDPQSDASAKLGYIRAVRWAGLEPAMFTTWVTALQAVAVATEPPTEINHRIRLQMLQAIYREWNSNPTTCGY
jgi:hypothetical protein